MSLQQGHINEVLSAGIADVKEDKIAIAVFENEKMSLSLSCSLPLSLSLFPRGCHGYRHGKEFLSVTRNTCLRNRVVNRLKPGY